MKSLQTKAILSFLAIISFCAFCPAGEPIAHWTFDEGSGTTAHDSAGSHNGTITGATWTAGRIGGALNFDGNNDYVQIPNHSDFDFPAGFTLCAWAKPALSSLDARLIYRYDPTSKDGYMLSQYYVSYNFNVAVDNLGFYVASDVPPVVGQWAFVVGVRENNGDIKMYIDGVLQSTISNNAGVIDSSGDLFIGVDYILQKDFKGIIDDVRIYNYPLDANEVQELYAQGLPEPPEAKLIAHWTFDETSGTTAYDSADSHNGTVVGNPVRTAGQVDGCLDFDGNGDYVDFGDIDELEFGNNDFTVVFWFYTKGPHNAGGDQGSYGAIVGKYNWGLGRQWWFQQAPDGKINFATYYTQTSGEGLISTNGYPAGQWVHCVGVRQGPNKYLYINGIHDVTGPCQGVLTGRSTKVLIGAIQDPDKYYQFFNGKIDDVRIYNYALDANEVAELYDAGIPDLQSIEIVGPNSVPEESDTQYQVIGHYDNNSTLDITSDANFTVAPDEFAAIDVNGLLTTYRLYRMQETCTIYADCQGFATEKPVKIYPLCDGNECTQQQLLNRNIADTIQIKQDVMDDLEYAMKIERASIQMLIKMPWNPKSWGHLFKPCSPGQLIKARVHLLAALMWEQWANKEIDKSVDSLEDALELLQLEKPGNGKK